MVPQPTLTVMPAVMPTAMPTAMPTVMPTPSQTPTSSLYNNRQLAAEANALLQQQTAPNQNAAARNQVAKTKTNITSSSINAAYFLLGISSFVVAYYAGDIDAAWIAILAFVGAGIMFGLSVRRFSRYLYAKSLTDMGTIGTIFTFGLFGKNVVDPSVFGNFDPSTIDTNPFVNEFPTSSIVLSAVTAALAGWGVLEMNHGFLRTVLGFIGGLAAYETMMPVVVKFAPNV